MKDPRIEQIADYYGLPNQINMLIEESAEFIQAVNKAKRANGADEYKVAVEHMEEELADVIIVAKQLRYLFGKDNIDRIIDAKLDRQIERIKKEVNNG